MADLLFAGQSYTLSEGMLRGFCELTAANEIEVAIDNSGLLGVVLQIAIYRVSFFQKFLFS